MLRSIWLPLALALAGCSAPRAPELDVEQQWSDAMRRLGLFAFYPATEDVRPGDIYLLVPPPSGKEPWVGRQFDAVVPWSRPDYDGSRFSLLRMATLAPLPQRPAAQGIPQSQMTTLDHIRAQQEERFRIQPLPREEDVLEEGARRAAGRPRLERISDNPPADAPYHLGHADQAARPIRLQRSAIPALTVARVTEGQLAAAGIFGNFAANLGLSSGSEVALTISLRDVQEINLDTWRVRALYDAHGSRTLQEKVTPNDMMLWLSALRGGRNWRYDLVDEACNGDADALRNQGVQVAIVTRVIYAGAIEYSFSRRAATAVQAALDLQGALAQNIRQPPQVPAAVVVNNTNNEGAQNQNQNQNQTPASQVRDAIAARLSGLTGITAAEGARAGVRSTFGIGTFGSLSLTETFNRPIAVGAGSRMRLAFHQVLAGREESDVLSDRPPRNRPILVRRFEDTEETCAVHFQMRGRRDFSRAALWSAMTGGDTNVPPVRMADPGVAPPGALPQALSPGAQTSPQGAPPASGRILRAP